MKLFDWLGFVSAVTGAIGGVFLLIPIFLLLGVNEALAVFARAYELDVVPADADKETKESYEHFRKLAYDGRKRGLHWAIPGAAFVAISAGCVAWQLLLVLQGRAPIAF